MIRAHRYATALVGRAGTLFHGFRHTATIACAVLLAGCGREAFEADPIQYSTVAGYADMDFGYASKLARDALSDGFLSNVEYITVMNAVDAQREAQFRLDRDRAIAKHRRRPS